jgi:hypothetical protein
MINEFLVDDDTVRAGIAAQKVQPRWNGEAFLLLILAGQSRVADRRKALIGY